MFCTKCGKKIEDGASFCTNCGQSVPEKETIKKLEESSETPVEVSEKKEGVKFKSLKELESEKKKEEKKTKTTKSTKKEKVEKKETPKEETKETPKEEDVKVEEKPINNVNQPTYAQPVIQPKEQISGTAIASLVMGIISFAICFLFAIIALPLSIAGFCLGIATKQKSGIKIGGIILNTISAALSILILVLFGSMIIMAFINILKYGDFEEPIEIDNPIYNPVEGEWDCKGYNNYTIGDNYLFTLELEDDHDFTWYETGKRYSNYAKGFYTYTKLDKTSNDGNFNYYTVTLNSTEGSDNGTKPVKNHVTKYKMGVLDDEAIITDTETNLKYYCYR